MKLINYLNINILDSHVQNLEYLIINDTKTCKVLKMVTIHFNKIEIFKYLTEKNSLKH